MAKQKNYKAEEALKLIGERIRTIRKEKKLSQEELANLCDIELSQINRIELGKINTSISHLLLIAKTLEVPPEDLIKNVI
ncbi:MAG: helix-turn-helix transcriptional regulator [Chitinophagales bacterium]|nr:helix-turn-helix transcriptional regulator [Chitinophagales bacterium]